MNKSFYIFFLPLFFALLPSCNSFEEPLYYSEENETITFSLAIDNASANCGVTRSFSDAKSISVVKCYVYNQTNGANAQPVKIVDINLSNLKGEFSMSLPKGQTFDLVFLATSIPHVTSGSKLFYSTTERTLAVNYSSLYTNDEEIDCFFTSKRSITTETKINETIILRRPFAQINVGAKNYADYNSSFPIQNVSISVTGVYNKINLMDGNVVGNPVTANFSASTVPTGQTFPVSGSEYLGMTYILVNSRKLVDVTISINHLNPSYPTQTRYVNSVAVERNYQTNLIIKNLNE